MQLSLFNIFLSKLTGRRRYFPQVIERKSVMVETSGSNMVTDVADDLDVEEHVVGHIEEVEDQIIADDKCVDVVDTGDEDLLRHQDSRWGVVGNKRNYTEMDHEDDLDEEMDPHYMQSQQQFRRTMDAARKRGRPRKFPAGMMPPEFLQRVQQKSIDPQIHDGEYEDEIVPQTSQANPIPRTIHNHGGRMVNPRGGTTMSGNAPRLQQPVLVPRGSSVGQASHIASQRLPSISGGPPKENKPLKVVTLLPTSRRVAGAASRPVVSGIRTLGHPNRPSRTPQLPIEKQAEQIINQSVKYADRIISSQTIGDFNKCIEQQNSQIANLHEDNRKLHAMYTGLLEFKENRIKQLEVQVERLTAEYTAATKNWQAQLLLVENLTKSDGPKEDEGSNSPEAENQSDQQEVSHPRAQRAWVIEERIVRHNANGEMTEEIIEQEVDEETFLRMQQEIDENGETLMMEPMHSHEEEVVDEPTVNNDHALD